LRLYSQGRDAQPLWLDQPDRAAHGSNGFSAIAPGLSARRFTTITLTNLTGVGRPNLSRLHLHRGHYSNQVLTPQSDIIAPMSEPTQSDRTPVRHVEIDDTRDGQRLDNFLIAILKGVPKSRVYRILRKGEVRVNKGRVGPDYRLQIGDIVRIPPLRMSVESGPKVRADDFAWLKEKVIYEDEHLLAIDKPAGLAVHAGSGVNTGLIEAMRALRSELPMIELVHRIDRETSGCILLAKNRQTLTAMHRYLRTGQMKKSYMALIHGRLKQPRTISASIDRRVRGGERMMEASDEGEGKESASRFVPRRHFDDATLVEIDLLTGRTHQARVHAAHMGHPIAGDDKYGDRKLNQALGELGLKRLFLHAARLEFRHPGHNRKIVLEAPLPPELTEILDTLDAL
jgi:23S rRNA pseudouridine955/2504/2580 synthase